MLKEDPISSPVIKWIVERRIAMNKFHLVSLGIVLILVLSGCNLSLVGTSTPMPSPTTIPSPTEMLPSPAETTVIPETSFTPTPTISPMPPIATATPTSGGGIVILPGSPSGPYAVILVAPGDMLNIRSGPGIVNPVIATFLGTETNVIRTGPSAMVYGSLWVEVQKPGGGTGWVYAAYLTEYVPQATFCANTSVSSLITNLDTALTTDNGLQLSSLVSPAHGMAVYLWRYGNRVIFMPNDARWVFHSTYEHNWGSAPASGLETTGSFHVSVLPYLQDVFNASYTLTCNSLGTAPQYGDQPWPVLYTNVNYYTVFKSGTPGVDLDFRFFLVGVEFVQGQPYVFSLIHFAWEP
jgi:hypothetical protein